MLELNVGNFEEEVKNDNGLVIVDYWGVGCAPCEALMPDFEALSKEYEGQVKFAKLNTSENRKLAISQRVFGLPTIILYKNGEKLGDCTRDTASREGIEALIKSHI